MSFQRASAILSSRWLINKQWATAHLPLVFGVIRGEMPAAVLLGGDPDDDGDDDEKNTIPQNIANNVYQVSPWTDLSKLPDGSIAFLDIDGPLLKQGDWCSAGMEDYAELMAGIMQASNIDGVIIDIDSPGGQADGTATFADAIRECAQVKPVIGYIDDGMAASAAYWSISACTEVYTSQGTDQVGSIGVYCTLADWYAYYKSLGLPVKDVYAPQSTDKNLDTREALEGNEELLKEELGVIADAFISAVKQNRKGKLNGTDWNTGKMYFSQDAIAQGLIDGVKTFNQVAFRIKRLISQNKNSNNTMAFEKTLAAAKAEAFEVVEGGFLLQEDHLNAIEARIAESETEAAETATAVADATSARETAEAALVTANETVASQNATIEQLTAQVAEMSGKPGAEFKETSKPEDKIENAEVPYHLSEENPANKLADQLLPRKRS